MYVIMIRTQIYLPEELHRNLLLIARSERLTLSELIRKGAKKVIREKTRKDESAEVMKKLANFKLSGPKDLSTKHDEYYIETVLGDRDHAK